MTGRLLAAVFAVLALAGCRHAPAADGVPEGAVCTRMENVQWNKEVKIGVNTAVMTANMDLPLEPGARKMALELMGEAWWMATGRHGEAPVDLAGVEREFEKAIAEVMDANDVERTILPYADFTGRITWADEYTVSYQVDFDVYFGGAHPDHWIACGVYSRRLGRRLWAEDLFGKEGMLEAVNRIRAEIAANNFNSESLRANMQEPVKTSYEEYEAEVRRDDLWEPLVTDNFIFGNRGVSWCYNEYEISSYSDGYTWVTLER